MKKIINKNVLRYTLHATRESGQILLILVMIMAIAITIVLTMTFTSRTDTQLTKLEEESQKALAAAEAGIEYTLKTGTALGAGSNDLSSIGNLSQTISSGTTTITSSSSTEFISPTMQSGEAFTFYLGSYNPSTKLISNPSSDNNISIAYDISENEQCDEVVLDIAVVTATGATRYIADTGNNFNSTASQLGSKSDTTVSGSTFHCITSAIPITTASNPRLMVVRFLPVGASPPTNTPLGFVGTSNLPVSGRTVSSQATTKTGVTKKVQLFQSYPQIPAEFFFTSF